MPMLAAAASLLLAALTAVLLRMPDALDAGSGSHADEWDAGGGALAGDTDGAKGIYFGLELSADVLASLADLARVFYLYLSNTILAGLTRSCLTQLEAGGAAAAPALHCALGALRLLRAHAHASYLANVSLPALVAAAPSTRAREALGRLRGALLSLHDARALDTPGAAADEAGGPTERASLAGAEPTAAAELGAAALPAGGVHPLPPLPPLAVRLLELSLGTPSCPRTASASGAAAALASAADALLCAAWLERVAAAARAADFHSPACTALASLSAGALAHCAACAPVGDGASGGMLSTLGQCVVAESVVAETSHPLGSVRGASCLALSFDERCDLPVGARLRVETRGGAVCALLGGPRGSWPAGPVLVPGGFARMVVTAPPPTPRAAAGAHPAGGGAGAWGVRVTARAVAPTDDGAELRRTAAVLAAAYACTLLLRPGVAAHFL
ncbi:hypothetical protein T492DRAFT_831303 [Pavlovales sp. CCMP2436]|nr:hypothetical protein T492DRAFT_831303 [Pavlovales sp. CCMP2436]